MDTAVDPGITAPMMTRGQRDVVNRGGEAVETYTLPLYVCVTHACAPLKPLDGMRCRLTRIFVIPKVTRC